MPNSTEEERPMSAATPTTTTPVYRPGDLIAGPAHMNVTTSYGTVSVPNLSPRSVANADKVRKIALVGYTESQRDAPWDDPDWVIWGLNNLHLYIREAQEKGGGDYAWNGWFDLHDLDTIRSDKEHEAWLRQPHDFPIWTWDPQPEWPSAVPYPRDDILRKYRPYFTNSISWMFALAMEAVSWAIGDGAEIGVYGIDMAQGTEYAAQRPSCEYFIGLAEGRGIDVTIAKTSDLLKVAGQYGGAETEALRAKLKERSDELARRMGEAQAEHAKAANAMREIERAIDQMTGAREAYGYITGVWVPPGTDPGAPRAANDVRSTSKE
jgi:hypothetical protein